MVRTASFVIPAALVVALLSGCTDGSGPSEPLAESTGDVEAEPDPPRSPATLDGVRVDAVTETTATVAWTVGAERTVLSFVEYGPAEPLAHRTPQVFGTGAQTATLTGLAGNATYLFRVVARTSGVNDTVSAIQEIHTAVPVVPTPTALHSVWLTGISERNATVRWAIEGSSEGIESWVEFGKATTYGQATQHRIGPGVHVALLEGLGRPVDIPTQEILRDSNGEVRRDANGNPMYVTYTVYAAETYHFRVVVLENGQPPFPPGRDRTFTTSGNDPYYVLQGAGNANPSPPAGDSTPPDLSGITAMAVSDTEIYVTWSASDSGGGVQSRVQWGIGSLSAQSAWIPGSGTQSYTITGLSPGTTYVLLVQAIDDVGNPTQANGPSVTTSGTPPPDTTPPSITGVSVGAVTETGATVSWTVSDLGPGVTSRVRYGTSTCSTDAALQTGTGPQSTALTGLTPSTSYKYCVYAVDGASNSALTVPATFMTNAWAPVGITGVSVTSVLTTSMQVSWTAAGPSDVQSKVEYETAADGPFPPYTLASAVQSGPGAKSVTLTGLTPATVYNLRITASSVSSGGSSASANQQQATLVPTTITGCCGAGTIATATAPAGVPIAFQVTNANAIGHTWEIQGESYLSPAIAGGGGVYIFTSTITLAAGTYTQHCTLHPAMTGTLNVV